MRKKVSFVLFTILIASLCLIKPNLVLAVEKQTQSQDVMLLTVDQVDQLEITGAKYRLEKKENEAYITVGGNDSFVVGADGYMLNDLSYGQYRLTETMAPNGYNLISEAVTFEVNENGVSLLKTMNCVTVIAANNGTYKLVVSNEIGNLSRLPSTGGIGTTPYTVGGISLIMLAGIGMFFYLKKHRYN